MGSPIIFKSTMAKLLTPNLSFNDAIYYLTGTVDPSAVATNAPAGSLYSNTSTGNVYHKTDNGSSTNWSILQTPTYVNARYTTAAGQSIPDNAFTIVDFGTLDFENGGSNVTTGASWHFTAPSTGVYFVTSTIRFTATIATGTFAMQVAKNGSQYGQLSFFSKLGITNDSIELNGSTLVSAAATDTIDIRAFQQTGGALALNNSSNLNHISIAKVG